MRAGPRAGEGGCWPTPLQEQLLRAALLEGPEALAAWEDWSSQVPDLGALDNGSIRTLPALYANLRALGVRHQRMELIRGTYRKSWYQNRLLLSSLEQAISAVSRAGVRTLVLKGAALVVTAYPDLALRPMNDVDLLVPPDDAERAVQALLESGYRTFRADDVLTRRRLEVGYAITLLDRRGQMLDLHWRAVGDAAGADADGPLWEAATGIRIGDARSLAFEPSHQLLHVCVHGVRWNPVPPMRWVVDARTILRAGGVDPGRLAETADRLGLVVPLEQALACLDRLFPHPVVAEALAGLRAARPPAWHRREQRLRVERPGPVSRALLQWYRHRRLAARLGPVRRVLSFPPYVRDVYRLGSLLDLPRYLLVEAPRLRARARLPRSELREG